ncbi:cytochrome c maturation protein CcmE [Fulvivirga sp. RKSG066]|uniref:cytochrome c maturation protein CcmE domain-containing protein n=1 Tax=Fulvivirga aurantia TaxID=2529383 RepID=UPI0012BD1F40|nr:cytochrome c maturation protein CcmE [Fulvivirga aurantia]MTI21118.1 cytochrome c maturation protein CcmE [Fulvivirga aurantia]
MKKSHIIGIIIIGVAIAVIISTAGDASSYVNFDKAYEMASNGNNNSIHVVGELKKSAQGDIVGIQPSNDKLSFSFLMVDENKNEQIVFYNEPMPPDFKRSEKVVVIGSYNEDVFVADKILMKCPSKYQENTVKAEI